MFERKKKQRE